MPQSLSSRNKIVFFPGVWVAGEKIPECFCRGCGEKDFKIWKMKFKPCQDLFILIVKRLLWRGVRVGRRSTIGNRVCPEGYQEFESLPLRQYFQGFCAYCMKPFFTSFSLCWIGSISQSGKKPRQWALVWNDKNNGVCSVVLPFQTIEPVDEPRAEKPVNLNSACSISILAGASLKVELARLSGVITSWFFLRWKASVLDLTFYILHKRWPDCFWRNVACTGWCSRNTISLHGTWQIFRLLFAIE